MYDILYTYKISDMLNKILYSVLDVLYSFGDISRDISYL